MGSGRTAFEQLEMKKKVSHHCLHLMAMDWIDRLVASATPPYSWYHSNCDEQMLKLGSSVMCDSQSTSFLPCLQLASLSWLDCGTTSAAI